MSHCARRPGGFAGDPIPLTRDNILNYDGTRRHYFQVCPPQWQAAHWAESRTMLSYILLKCNVTGVLSLFLK